MTCNHDLAERETACADGLCPLCLSEQMGKLQAWSDEALVWMDHARRYVLGHSALKPDIKTWVNLQSRHDVLTGKGDRQIPIGGEGEAARLRTALKNLIEDVEEWDPLGAGEEPIERAQKALRGEE